MKNKYTIGDWVYYESFLYQIVDMFTHGRLGETYTLQSKMHGNVKTVSVSEGDEKFRKA